MQALEKPYGQARRPVRLHRHKTKHARADRQESHPLETHRSRYWAARCWNRRFCHFCQAEPIDSLPGRHRQPNDHSQSDPPKCPAPNHSKTHGRTRDPPICGSGTTPRDQPEAQAEKTINRCHAFCPRITGCTEFQRAGCVPCPLAWHSRPEAVAPDNRVSLRLSHQPILPHWPQPMRTDGSGADCTHQTPGCRYGE